MRRLRAAKSAHTTRKQQGFKTLVNSDKDSGTLVYQVAVPSPLRRTFDYLPPAEASSQSPLQPGIRVRVPFGRRSVVGVIVAPRSNSQIAQQRLKAIGDVLDAEPLFNERLFSLLLWSARYYHHPLGEVLLKALPPALRTGKALPTETLWRLTEHGLGLPADALKRAPRQQQVLRLLQNGEVERPALAAAGVTSATLRTLREKRLIETVQRRAEPEHTETADVLAERALELTPEQRATVDAIDPAHYQAYLLEGETGSGKTEVYLQIIARVLARGQQALVLVPEIGLTPQTLARFRNRFRCRIAAVHSALNDGELLEAWHAAANGSARIIVGTRSAIFSPAPNLGVIIVDEEHDASFKQQEGFRYSARDLAVMRANRDNIPVVLGSATPSLESTHNCQAGRYRHLELRGRHGGAIQPTWHLVDIRKLNLNTGFSAAAIQAMEDELAAGHQVLVFLNRRGLAPTVICHDCAWIAKCESCDARMTLHRRGVLVCHHCQRQRPVPDSCPACHSPQLQYLGQGTERGEDTLLAMFPKVPVIRVDRDSTRKKNAFTELVEEVNKGKPCILVGTQMLAKGHHFPNVTLVVVLDIDAGLYSPDFRAAERTGQMITQVAGRAGRGEQPGRVLIQTHYRDHPLLDLLARHQYPTFARQLLAERRLTDMPPYTNMALIRAEATIAGNAVALLEAARDYCNATLAPSPEVRYLGPFPAALERRNNRYRYQLRLIVNDRGPLHLLLDTLGSWLESSELARKCRWSLDVDPIETS